MIWIQDQNTDSQLSVFFTFEWGQNSSDATSVSDVCVANNGSKVSDTIFLSDASNVNGNISSNVCGVINVVMLERLVMFVRLVKLER